MRAVKSILLMAGNIKRLTSNKSTEDELLIKAILDSNMPKFLKEDLPLFKAIVQDLFPSLKIETGVDHELLGYVEAQSEMKMKSCAEQEQKI